MCKSIIVSLVENIFKNENFTTNYSLAKKKTDDLLNEMILKESLIDSFNCNHLENYENVSVNDGTTVSSANVSDNKYTLNNFKAISPSSDKIRRVKSKKRSSNSNKRKNSTKKRLVVSTNLDEIAKNNEEPGLKNVYEENSDYYINIQDDENVERDLNKIFENNINQKKKKNKHKKFKIRKSSTNSMNITQNNLHVLKKTLSIKPKIIQNNIQVNEVKSEKSDNNQEAQSIPKNGETNMKNRESVREGNYENLNEINNCNMNRDLSEVECEKISNFFNNYNNLYNSSEIHNNKPKFNKYNILNSQLNSNQSCVITNILINEDIPFQNTKLPIGLTTESLIPPLNYMQYIPKNIFPSNFDFDQKYLMTMMNPFLNMPIENFNILRKFEEHLFPKNFEIKLHNDILDYSNKILKINNFKKEIKLDSLRFIENLIKQSLGNNNIFIDIHGSFATDLSIECSDIDLTVRLVDQYSNIESLINALFTNFSKLHIFESLVPIYTASVPILKIQVNPLYIIRDQLKEEFLKFKNSEVYEKYKFNQDELNKIKIDITFTDKSSKTHCTYSAVEWAKKQIFLYPEIKPLVHVIKRHLQINKLNSSFNGGLSSHSLLLMIVAFIKYYKCIKMRVIMDLGTTLLEFYNFFGNIFEFTSGIIDINQINPIFMLKERLDSYPIIHDPLNYLNVAKNSYRINEVKQIFSSAFDLLQKKKLEMKENNYNIEYENMIYEMFFFYRKSIILSNY